MEEQNKPEEDRPATYNTTARNRTTHHHLIDRTKFQKQFKGHRGVVKIKHQVDRKNLTNAFDVHTTNLQREP